MYHDCCIYYIKTLPIGIWIRPLVYWNIKQIQGMNYWGVFGGRHEGSRIMKNYIQHTWYTKLYFDTFYQPVYEMSLFN